VPLGAITSEYRAPRLRFERTDVDTDSAQLDPVLRCNTYRALSLLSAERSKSGDLRTSESIEKLTFLSGLSRSQMPSRLA
jgi:hypothetical protein